MMPYLLYRTLLLMLLCRECATSPRAEPANYSRQERHILAAKCLAYHGPDEERRAAELRQRRGLLEDTLVIWG